MGCLIASILLSACQQNIPAPVVSPAPIIPQPVVAPVPQPKKIAPKPQKKVVPPKEDEEDLVPVLPLRPSQVGSRPSILP